MGEILSTHLHSCEIFASKSDIRKGVCKGPIVNSGPTSTKFRHDIAAVIKVMDSKTIFSIFMGVMVMKRF